MRIGNRMTTVTGINEQVPRRSGHGLALRGAVLAASCLVMVGCGSNGASKANADRNGAPNATVQAKQSSMKGVHNALISVGCASDTQRSAFALTAVSATDGSTIRTYNVLLPAGMTPTYDCNSLSYELRQVFDADYEHVAVTTQNETDGSSHVGSYDVKTGNLTEFTTTSTNQFATAPKDTHAIFRPGSSELWYADQLTGIISSKSTPNATAQSHGSWGNCVDRPGIICGPVSGKLYDKFTVSAANVVAFAGIPSPSGDVVSQDQARIFPRYSPTEDGNIIAQFYGSGLAGQPKEIDAWLDDHRVLVTTDSATPDVQGLAILTLSSDRSTIVSTHALTPASDRRNFSPVPVGPDRVAFISTRASERDLFIVNASDTPPAPKALTSSITAGRLLDWIA